MQIHYYLSVYPLEALIASQLPPEEFGRYMVLGQTNGSHEAIMFAELEGEFGSVFDWEYAKRRCVPHPDGTPKHTVWMSVYRTLEHVELKRLQSLYLTTEAGKSLVLPRGSEQQPGDQRSYYIYQELCPTRPLVVSALDPLKFSQYITDPSTKVHLPSIVFADLKVVDLENFDKTGNIGAAYEHNRDHLSECIRQVTTESGKPHKNVERSVRSFSYQIINDGVFFGNGSQLVRYPMPTFEELKREHYDWSRTAMIV